MYKSNDNLYTPTNVTPNTILHHTYGQQDRHDDALATVAIVAHHVQVHVKGEHDARLRGLCKCMYVIVQ